VNVVVGLQTYVLDVHPFNPRIAMSAGYDGRVIIWDIWEGHPIKVYDTGEYNLVDGNFSPDGSSLVVSDEVGQIYIFGTGPGMAQKDVKYDQVGPFSNVVLGHNWFIYDLLSKDFIL
jgi:PH-interacting protein